MKKIFYICVVLMACVAQAFAQTCDYDPQTGVIKIYKHDGSLNGNFTINASGNKVIFSQGNLMYSRASTSTPWAEGKFSFMAHQWDVVETAANPYCTSDYGNKTAIGLFGWGTKTNPWNTSTSGSQYSWNEWGDNAISNGGNMANSGWRTLTKAEWNYLFQNRSGNRFAKANVHGVNGIILLPDGWTQAASSMSGTLSGINNESASYSAVSDANWTILEGEGCVFLPAAGRRMGTQVINTNEYWTSTDYGSTYACPLFGYRCFDYSSSYDFNRSSARAVRLVKNVPNP